MSKIEEESAVTPNDPPPSYDDDAANALEAKIKELALGAGLPIVSSQPCTGGDLPTVVLYQHPRDGYEDGTPFVLQVEPVFGEKPVQMICPRCRKFITTEPFFEGGVIAWTLVTLLCATGLFVFSCLPLCVDAIQDATHVCPYCQAYVGKFHRVTIRKRKKPKSAYMF